MKDYSKKTKELERIRRIKEFGKSTKTTTPITLGGESSVGIAARKDGRNV
jgi:hypothetical protein